jgi:beta-glucosidase
MHLPGTEGGNAAADLLSGKVNPCGKVSMSFPKSMGQCPVYYNALPTGRPKPIERDDEFLGWATGYVDCGNLALYPFGYGLSYSKFVYEDLKLSKTEFTNDDEVEVTVTVYNDSDVEGKETIMIYYRDVFASMSRPVQQLLDFKKVEFKAHERKEITFKVREENFRFWNVKNEYISEKGEFLISTGYADNLIHTKSLYLK